MIPERIFRPPLNGEVAPNTGTAPGPGFPSPTDNVYMKSGLDHMIGRSTRHVGRISVLVPLITGIPGGAHPAESKPADDMIKP